MHIALLYNEPLPSLYTKLGEDLADSSVVESVDAIQRILESRGHSVTRISLRPPLTKAVAAVADIRADVVFNLFEGFEGRPKSEWQVAMALEMSGLAFTGARARTLALCLDKARAKQTLAAKGIPTPPFQLLQVSSLERFCLGFPVIVKPLREDASHGLNAGSVAFDPLALAEQVAWVQSTFRALVLVETFLPGREFNVSVLGGPTPRVLPLTEIVYDQDMPGPKILSYTAKWVSHHPTFLAANPICPAPVPEAVGLRIKELALAAHRVVGSPPYARVDLRADEEGTLHVLEVNPNPDLSLDAGMALQVRVSGMEYGDLIAEILSLGLEAKRVGGPYATSYAS